MSRRVTESRTINEESHCSSESDRNKVTQLNGTHCQLPVPNLTAFPLTLNGRTVGCSTFFFFFLNLFGQQLTYYEALKSITLVV